MRPLFDVAIIGAGVVGTAIAREFSKYELSTCLIEAQPDVGMGTSKANTAILHTGFDAKPGTLEARLLTRGYELLVAYAKETGIATERTGANLIAWTDEQLAQIPSIYEKSKRNGVNELHRLTAEEVYRAEPHLGPGALGGLFIPGESIICPFSPPIAYAKQAIRNGAELLLNHTVTKVEKTSEGWKLQCKEDLIHARWVINAAGLHSDTIDTFFANQRFTVTPRRGELIVFDKFARRLIHHICLPIPTAVTKGVLISPTVFGNVLLGPTAEDIQDKWDTATTGPGLGALIEKGSRLLPELLKEEITATYAGLRAATEHSDYQIFCDEQKKYVCVGGIRSTGLSASLGIAEYVVQCLRESGFHPVLKQNFLSVQMPPLGEHQLRPMENADWIARNPDYGRIICHCEKVTAGELQDALNGPLGARSLDALRRRTRCLQGRCQGFYCLAHIQATLETVDRGQNQ